MSETRTARAQRDGRAPPFTPPPAVVDDSRDAAADRSNDDDAAPSTSGVAAFVMPFSSTVAVLLVAGLDGAFAPSAAGAVDPTVVEAPMGSDRRRMHARADLRDRRRVWDTSLVNRP